MDASLRKMGLRLSRPLGRVGVARVFDDPISESCSKVTVMSLIFTIDGRTVNRWTYHVTKTSAELGLGLSIPLGCVGVARVFDDAMQEPHLRVKRE